MTKKLFKRILVTSTIAVLGVSTSFAALVMERDQSVDTAPSVNMYRFAVPAELQGTYNNVGVANLTVSMEKEPNTLSMNVAHVKGNPSESYVVEVYKDLAA
ncbi:MAG: antibiotic biosynthesis monooxygenase, partial [Veillonella sp.]|nr:antibiotic biosynthesis monooxygenase [Veillonella sp.]